MVLENSSQKLRLLLFGRGTTLTLCTFDRNKNRAAVTKLGLVPPFRHDQVALSNVDEAVVSKVGRERYYPVLRLKSGDTIRIASRAKEQALELSRTIQSFLKPN